VAQALYKLEKGRIYPDPRAKNRWRRIAHRDIKPENIFLGEPAQPWNSYPYPLLADFDHAGMMSQADVRQPGGQKGTQGYSAPENMWRWDEDGEPKPDISPKSDIFVLGIVIWDLVHSSLGRAELRGIKINPVNTATMWSKDGTFLKEPSMEGKLPIKSYTARLTSLMWECLQINPDNRPDAKQLIERANAAIGDLEEKVTGPFLGKEPIAAHLQLMSRSREDRYPMGVRYNFKKRRAAGGNGGDDDDDDDGNDKDKDKGNDEEEEEDDDEEGDNNNEEEEEQRRRKRPKTGGGKAGKPGPVPEGYREDNDP
jgi:serine/threonine protein kinase